MSRTIFRRLPLVLLCFSLSAPALRADQKAAGVSNVEVIELRQTDEILRATYAPKKKMMLPRMVMLDGQGRLVYGGVGLPGDLGHRLHVALKDDRPIDSPIDLESILGETVRADGSAITAAALPKADAYVIDYWAEWCAPCRMLSRDLEGILKRWDDKHFVWLKIESDPEKLPEKRKG